MYRQGDRLILVTSDRLSAFDHVLTTIPFKGEMLNRLAAFWFERTKHIVPNHVLDVPDPNVTVARACEPFAIEVVVRGYLTGSLWRDYQKGTHTAYGLRFRRAAEGRAFPDAHPHPVHQGRGGQSTTSPSPRRRFSRAAGHAAGLGAHHGGGAGAFRRGPEVGRDARAHPRGHQVRVRQGGRRAVRHRRDAHPGLQPLLGARTSTRRASPRARTSGCWTRRTSASG